jgi:hypothetical protein
MKSGDPELPTIMKPVFLIPVVLSVVVPSMRAQGAPTVAMRDAATHEQLSLAYRSADQADPMRKLQVAKGADPTLANKPKDLVSQSDILCFGGAATLVPKRAILNVPKNLQDRLKFLPGSKVQNWSEFFALNRGWITTVEISRVQAEGNVPLDEKIAEHVRKSSNLVVATYLGGPISMLPPKVKEESRVTDDGAKTNKDESKAEKEEPKTTKP